MTAGELIILFVAICLGCAAGYLGIKIYNRQEEAIKKIRDIWLHG